jgi:hypothetical protein
MAVETWTISYPSGTIRENGVSIGLDDSTPAFQRYIAFLRGGGGPTQIADQEVPAVRTHITVSAWKLRKALNQVGMRQQIEDAVANSGDQNWKDAWEFVTDWDSDHPLLLAGLSSLNMTEEQMYSIFELAASL